MTYVLEVEQDYVSKTQRAAIHIQRGFRGHGARKKAKQKKKDQQDDAAALRFSSHISMSPK